MTRPIAITGATGFIGGALLSRLIANGPVRILVRRVTLETAAWARVGVEVILGDLDAADTLARFVRGADAIVHCAASMGKTDARHSHTVNVIGTERLARLARNAGVRRFVHLSSISVYAATRRPHDIITEDDTPEHVHRLNHYGHTKWLAERRLADAAGSDLPWTILRPTNVYGPGSGPWFHQWERWVRRMPFALGNVAIDLVHVDDLLDAIGLAVAADGVESQVLHVGHEMSPLNGFVQAVGRLTGHPVRALPARVDAAARYVIERGVRFVTRRHMSMALTRSVRYPHTRATSVLGYQPRVPLVEGLAHLAAWWRAHAAAASA
ncbi:MAG: NAD-dependent epimerase/dehydratase family protein [Gemmatimonadales bacterium]